MSNRRARYGSGAYIIRFTPRPGEPKLLWISWRPGGRVRCKSRLLGKMLKAMAILCEIKGESLVVPPDSAKTVEQYYQDPVAFLELFKRTFPDAEYELEGDPPRFEYEEGCIY